VNAVSETKFTSTEIQGWLEVETRSILSPVHTQAKQLRDEMNTALQSEIEVSKMLLDNSAKEIERRNMRVYNRARALNKLAHLFLDRLKKINVPDQVTYHSLSKFAQDIQKVFIVADIDVKNWFPRVSPFFIMDRRKFLTVHEKAKLTLVSLNDFITKEYVKTKTLEETFQQINELHAQEKQLADLEAQRESIKNELVPLEREISELEQEISELTNKGPIDQLKLIDTEAETINIELKHALRHLQKPFIKIQALAHQGGGSGLTQDELKTLNQYLEKPLEALASEQLECPTLKEVLRKLSRLIAEDKLKLKPDKARKAEQSSDDIVKHDSLANIHKSCVDVVARRKQLLSSAKMDEIKQALSLFQEQMEQLKARKASVETHEAVKEHAVADAKEKIRNYKTAIDKNVYASLGKKIQIA